MPVEREQRLDLKDRKIIEILLDNADCPLREISKAVGLSPSSVRNRILRLKRAGVIKKFTVEINYQKLGFNIQVIVLVTCKTGHSENVFKQFNEIPEVHDMYWTTGPANFILLVRVHDMIEFSKLITERLERIEGIEKLETLFLMPQPE